MTIIINKFPEYSVTDLGDIYSLYYKNRFGCYLRREPLLLRHNYSKTGYASVALGSQLNGEMRRVLVHRIVAESFIPNPSNKPFVNHKNGVKSDNRVENLEWVTHSENEIHAHKTGLKNFKGDNAPYKKLSSVIVSDIRAIGKSKTQREIAKTFGIDQSNVCKILKGISWVS